ncbi:MAG: 3-hydroxyacyl-CoA dehydrogenase NAD-binding domain-containing protein [Silicimonas sp.]|nr:3-hydroxyacyl-CoA dehydrogenase NAD-binding domain-containing protein [Silicimonas sp.]
MQHAHVASLGAGVIGASWTALFLASGRSVAVYDLDPQAETRVRAYVENAWPAMEALGLVKGGDPDRIRIAATAAEAVEGAEFVQESVPERLPIKHALYGEIEPVLGAGVVVSSSASGLTLEAVQQGWKDPSRMILGHPFNPPHLIPLVELTGNERTATGVIEEAEALYEAIGKVTIRLNKSVAGHVANRLQAAIWREAIHLVVDGVASVEDVDKAIWAGPGLRWAAMGPTTLFSLAAGEAGLAGYIDHFRDTFNGWWDELGEVKFTPEVEAKLLAGLQEATAGRSVADLAEDRDRLIVAMQQATQGMRRS